MPSAEFVKSHFRLTDYVESDLGIADKIRKNGKELHYCCPFHDEDTPSFVVYEDTQRFQCYGASCGKGGSIVDYVMLRNNCDVSRALQIISGEAPRTAKRIERKREAPTADSTPSMEKVKEYRGHLDVTVRYFGQRGITAQAVDTFLLGSQIDYAMPYTFHNEMWAIEAGTEKVWFHGQRHCYPWLSGKDVRSINKRRDDGVALAAIQKLDAELNYLIRCDMAAKWNSKPNRQPKTPGDISDQEMVEACLGSRFHRDGNMGTIFNLNRLFQLADDGSLVMEGALPRVRRLPYCLITEGEADAIAAEQLGFNAVAAKVTHGVNYRHAFSGVMIPIVAVDDDDAGVGYADQMIEVVGTRARRLFMKSGFKDVNDMVKAGLFIDWMFDQTGFKPRKEVIF